MEGLIFPEIVFRGEYVALDPFCLQQYILTNFVAGEHPVTELIGFGNDGA
jgi:hypothetical protein